MTKIVLSVLGLIVAITTLWLSWRGFQNRSVARKQRLLSEIDQKFTDLDLVLTEASPLFGGMTMSAIKERSDQVGLPSEGLEEAAKGFYQEVENFQEIAELHDSGKLARLNNSQLEAIRRTLDTGIRRWHSWLGQMPDSVRKILRGEDEDVV